MVGRQIENHRKFLNIINGCSLSGGSHFLVKCVKIQTPMKLQNHYSHNFGSCIDRGESERAIFGPSHFSLLNREIINNLGGCFAVGTWSCNYLLEGIFYCEEQ